MLLVEDDDSVRGVVARTLNGLGYSVIEARNGAEALGEGLSMAEPPDLVVTDLVMPKMNGRDLMRRLRELWPAVRALYMSGYSNELIDDPSGLGADAIFVEKPFRADQLALKVRAALDAPAPKQGR